MLASLGRAVVINDPSYFKTKCGACATDSDFTTSDKFSVVPYLYLCVPTDSDLPHLIHSHVGLIKYKCVPIYSNLPH